VARANGGGDDIANLRTSCRLCNIGKGVQNATEPDRNSFLERLRGIPKHLRKTWHGTGRCDECGTSVEEISIETDGWYAYCFDCAAARAAKGLYP